MSHGHNSMRVDEGRNNWKLLAIKKKKKARTEVGRGGKGLLKTDRGLSELRHREGKGERKSAKEMEGMSGKK